jgi:hypothetical protein
VERHYIESALDEASLIGREGARAQPRDPSRRGGAAAGVGGRCPGRRAGKMDETPEKKCPLDRTKDVANAISSKPECPELPRTHALADGELTGREAARARGHIVECTRCRRELAYLMQLSMAVARGLAGLDAARRSS